MRTRVIACSHGNCPVQVESQAIDRVHGVAQKHDVLVHRLVMAGDHSCPPIYECNSSRLYTASMHIVCTAQDDVHTKTYAGWEG